MIDAIQVEGTCENTYYDINDFSIKYIPNIKRINIFIGENNSGKSRFMRNLVVSDMAKILSNDYVEKGYTKSYRNDILSYIKKINEIDENFLYDSKLQEKTDTEFFYEIQSKIDIYREDNSKIEYPISSYITNIESRLNNMLSELCRVSKLISQTSITKQSPIYIPILRGIENFNIYFDIGRNKDTLNSISMDQKQRDALESYKDNANHIYLNKIQKAYGINQNLIFTAENLYTDITNKLLGEEKGREFIKDFQKFISEEFYDGKEFTLIPQKQKGYLNVKIGKQEKPLHELGDGIKQIITVLYKIFENKDNEKIFFIEEPELNLHPGFQRKLMEILQMDIFSKHQYFITTHSNHFIDSCFDYDNISIYKFTNINGANNKFRIVNSSPKDITLLQELGVNNSSVFLANCTIWLEGISDKILIKKYLEVYFKKKKITKYKEDINYAFVEYGGNNITHWDFEPTDLIETINASGITNKSFIICDNDNDSKGKKKRKENLKKIFKENYCELTVREIENTISKHILEKTLFDGNDVKYKKEFEQKDYTNKEAYMGKFIDEHYDLKRKYSSKNGSGTISKKLEFSKNIAKNIESYDDLTKQAQNLCEKIFEFIKKSNE